MQGYEYSNMQTKEPGTDSHILARKETILEKRLCFTEMTTLPISRDSPYARSFSTGLFLAGKRHHISLPGNFGQENSLRPVNELCAACILPNVSLNDNDDDEKAHVLNAFGAAIC